MTDLEKSILERKNTAISSQSAHNVRTSLYGRYNDVKWRRVPAGLVIYTGWLRKNNTGDKKFNRYFCETLNVFFNDVFAFFSDWTHKYWSMWKNFSIHSYRFFYALTTPIQCYLNVAACWIGLQKKQTAHHLTWN